jgi:membrane protein
MDSLRTRFRSLIFEQEPADRAARFLVNALRMIYFTANEFMRSHCFRRALELAYGTLFTLVPFTTLFLLLARGVGYVDRWIQEGRSVILNLTIGILPPEDTLAIVAVIDHAFEAILRGLETSSTFKSIISVLVLIAFTIGLMLSIENVFNDIFGVQRRRPFLNRVTAYWSILTLSPLFLAASMYARSWIMDFLILHQLESTLTNWGLRFLLPFLVAAMAFFVLYLKLPYTRVRLTAALGGALTACALWEVAKTGLSWYLRNNVSYKNIYGTLGTIPIFLLFLYVTWVIILLGAEVAYAGHHFHQIRRREVLRHLGERVHPAYLAVKLAVLLADRFRRGAGPSAADDLAADLQTDAAQVEGMLERLEEAELVVAVAQPEGAFQLARSPSAVTLEALVRGAGALEHVPTGDGRLSEVLLGMRRAGVEAVRGYTLEDLLKPEAIAGGRSASG